MSRVLSRKNLTDQLITLLQGTGFPVGDADSPVVPTDPLVKHAGWNGDPNTQGSVYVPYVVLTPVTVTVTSGPISDPQADVRVPYQLTTFGVNRGQVEELADRARQALLPLAKQHLDLGGVDHKVQQVEFPTVGGIARVDAADPPTFGEVDTVTVWLAK